MELVRKFGPYLAVELLLPGGTLVALALYLFEKNLKGNKINALENA